MMITRIWKKKFNLCLVHENHHDHQLLEHLCHGLFQSPCVLRRVASFSPWVLVLCLAINYQDWEILAESRNEHYCHVYSSVPGAWDFCPWALIWQSLSAYSCSRRNLLCVNFKFFTYQQWFQIQPNHFLIQWLPFHWQVSSRSAPTSSLCAFVCVINFCKRANTLKLHQQYTFIFQLLPWVVVHCLAILCWFAPAKSNKVLAMGKRLLKLLNFSFKLVQVESTLSEKLDSCLATILAMPATTSSSELPETFSSKLVLVFNWMLPIS